ncbi:MAG: efflux RND transporter periplasmic adaptor subunit [Desulfuromonadaceae bacterium]|nr:efflux RND transporter periplasmic adaptor subunit [Desulfuromonadaceae bacterium]
MAFSRFISRRMVLGGVVLLIIGAVSFIRLQGKKVTGIPVERKDLLQTVVTTGRVTSLARVDVGSQILGSVAAVLVDSGDRVRAGQILIQLRDDEARAALDQAQAVVREQEERLKQIGNVDRPVSQQRVAEAEATLRQATSTYDRAQKLYDAGITSRADFDDAVRARDVAAGIVERERLQRSNSRPQGGDIKLVEARLSQARAAVDGARERLVRTVITAPGDGTVIGRKVEVGDVVQPGVPLLVLSRTGRTQITAQLDEKNLGLLRVGQTAVGSADAYPDRSFPARLVTVVPAVDPQRGTVEARCDVTEPPPYLVPDMTVSLEIEVARHARVLTVPSEAVRDASSAPWVMVARDGRAERQDISLGIRGSGSSEVKKGLKEGEIILSGAEKIAVGSRIRLQVAAADRRAGDKSNAH